MHYDKPPEQTEPSKTREEQDEDYKTYFEPYADKNCPTCFGTAKAGWDTKNLMYVPCTCLLNNLNKEIEKERQAGAEQGGVLQKIAAMFGRN